MSYTRQIHPGNCPQKLHYDSLFRRYLTDLYSLKSWKWYCQPRNHAYRLTSISALLYITDRGLSVSHRIARRTRCCTAVRPGRHSRRSNVSCRLSIQLVNIHSDVGNAKFDSIITQLSLSRQRRSHRKRSAAWQVSPGTERTVGPLMSANQRPPPPSWWTRIHCSAVAAAADNFMEQ